MKVKSTNVQDMQENPAIAKLPVIGCFYYVNIIGTGTLLLKWGFHKYDFFEKEPCFLTDEGYRVNESDYDSFVFAF
jgi:hypothetical protein